MALIIPFTDYMVTTDSEQDTVRNYYTSDLKNTNKRQALSTDDFPKQVY